MTYAHSLTPPSRHASHPQVGNEAKRVAKLHAAVAKLPATNLVTLKFLLAHLNRVRVFEKENKMSAGNLSIVFGPTLLRKRDDGTGVIDQALLQDVS